MTRTKRFQAMLEPELFDWLEKMAGKERVSMSGFVRKLLWREREVVKFLNGANLPGKEKNENT